MPTDQDKVIRKLRAILSADVKGYSLLMADDEAFTIKTLKTYRNIMSDLIKQHNGRVVDSPGDNVLAEFASVVDAVTCATEVQKVLKVKNEDLPDDKKLEFRIGVNIGDVVQDGDRIYGNGVNVAARIEGLAEPGGVCISRNAYDHIRNKLKLGYEYLGDHKVKNIKDPVRVYKVLMGSGDTGKLIGVKSTSSPKKWVILSAFIAAIVLLLTVWQINQKEPEPTGKPSIAILPFENMSNDPEQEYFSDGMTDTIITDLSKLAGLKVISRNSAFTYKGKDVKIPEVAKELDVRYILEGSVQKAGNQIRIIAQLIDSQTDSHIWADRFDDTMDNIFELQDSITNKIVTALAVKLAPDEENRIKDKGTENISAYDLYLKGAEHFEKFTPQDWLKAIEYYKQALKIDPDFTRIYERLAEVYWFSNMHGFFNEMNLHPFTARLYARKYLESSFDDQYPSFRGYRVAASMAILRRQYKKSIELARTCVELAPNEWRANSTLGRLLIYSDKPKEALTFINKSIEIDPRNRMGTKLCDLGFAYFGLGQLEKAIEYINKGQKINPRLVNYSGILAASYAYLGKQDEAKAEIENYLKSVATFHVPAFSWLLYMTPYKNYDDFDRFASGLVKAGYPGDPKAYNKIIEENKLTEEEIKKIYSPPLRSQGRAEGKVYFMSFFENGEAYYDKPHPYYGSPSKGKWWIDGDMVCSQWDTIFDGLTSCANVYHIDELESQAEYISVSDLAHMPFSIE